MARPKALISWSSGKDSAFALHEVQRAGEFDVVGALTTVTETFGRVSIHGVRQEILEAQCEAAGLPPRIVPIPYPCPNEIYEARMREAVAQAVADGVTHMIFGDLFLLDIRAYREQKLAGTGITPVFPLWQRPTLGLARATCMVAGPMFSRRLAVATGERVARDGYAYCDWFSVSVALVAWTKRSVPTVLSFSG
jgi:diphthamide synthase (EF-2-diphthine--ammonia ligase)